MISNTARYLLLAFSCIVAGTAGAADRAGKMQREGGEVGRVAISTIPLDPKFKLRTATYTPSGKVLVSYADKGSEDEEHVNLAVMDDDGENMKTFFSQEVPLLKKANGIRFMVFPDNTRIFLGDYIIECTPTIDTCDRSELYPVAYPEAVAGGANVAHRWSEIIIAPDNRHVAWTTLLSNYSAVVLTGQLEKAVSTYRIVEPRIVSTLDPFREDPEHSDGVVPSPVRNGEVKQFVEGGSAISMVGAVRYDTPDSVVQDLRSGEIEAITNTPGYNETTIFSPDETLGITMSTRFSEPTNPAILGLMPRPHPTSLNMGLSMYAYTYAVTGVRRSRPGNVGPVLIDIESSKAGGGYVGTNLSTQEEWVYHSPISWHPEGRKAMWLEGLRGVENEEEREIRMRRVELLDYQPGSPVAAGSTPDSIPYASSDLSLIEEMLERGQNMDVKVYGRHSGHIEFRRTAMGRIEKIYADFSDDGKSVYSGSEKIQRNPSGRSTYTAKVQLSGPEPGVMDLKMTFGPLGGKRPAQIIFETDDTGQSLSHGYAEYNGTRLSVDKLVP